MDKIVESILWDLFTSICKYQGYHISQEHHLKRLKELKSA